METSPPAAQAADSNVPAVTPAEPSVPAVAEAIAPAMGFDEPAPAAPGQPVSVAFLPLALAAFVIIAFVLAAWTFLAAAGG